MRIVVDAMGTDTRPDAEIEGAIHAARQFKDTIILVGQEKILGKALKQYDIGTLPIEIVHAEQEILMTDKPAIASKEKKNSSIHVGLQLVKDGYGDAFVTAGNTGAAHAIAMLYTLKRISGVKRPALSAIFPINRKPVIFLDVGANTDSKPDWMAQYAIMGHLYAQHSLKLSSPRVGLLSNGEEQGKGNQLTLETDALLRTLPLRYIGNVEPVDIMYGNVDVVVSDGFTGNILLKTFEASVHYLTKILREELKSNPINSLGALLATPAFKSTRKRMDTDEVGGAPLLGVNGVVIIAHGGSNARAITSAINQARMAVNGNVIDYIKESFEPVPTLD